MHKGEILHRALRRERVIEDELLTLIRMSPANTPENAEAVILESNGDFSVIQRSGPAPPSTPLPILPTSRAEAPLPTARLLAYTPPAIIEGRG